MAGEAPNSSSLKREASQNAEDETPIKEVDAPAKPEGYFEHGPEKPEDGPLDALTIAQKEAEKIALYKEPGEVPPVEPGIGISPEQRQELQHEIEMHKHGEQH